MKVRLDKELVQQGFVASRERAQAMILAGRVLVAGQKADKPGTQVETGAELRLLGEDMRYVSRGGLKLERAVTHWSIPLEGRACADIGASTGGFTDCMLQHGAATVLAVDTGYGQIAHKLRVDARVKLRERCNARTLAPGELAGQNITFVAVDVAFISATLVLPAVIAALAPLGDLWTGEVVVLVKPQFEAGREHVGKGGIVRDEAAWGLAIGRVRGCVEELGAQEIEVIDSPITGMEGNREFLLHAVFAERSAT